MEVWHPPWDIKKINAVHKYFLEILNVFFCINFFSNMYILPSKLILSSDHYIWLQFMTIVFYEAFKRICLFRVL